jgi:hypothetical protein
MPTGMFGGTPVLDTVVRRYWTDASWPLRLVLAGLVILTIALCFPFGASVGSLTLHADGGSTMRFHEFAGNGWDKHAWAFVVVPALWLAYLTNIKDNQHWQRWGWGLTPLLIFFCVMNGDNTFPAPNIAFIAVGFSLLAAVIHYWNRFIAKPDVPGDAR